MSRLQWCGWGAAIFLSGYLVGTQGPSGPEVQVQAGSATVRSSPKTFRPESTIPSTIATSNSSAAPVRAAIPAADGKLRIIAFGAHPDDCELKVGGTAARWAALGHQVKLVSVTNGDIGHWQMAGGPLAQRRLAEAQKADKIRHFAAKRNIFLGDWYTSPVDPRDVNLKKRGVILFRR